MKLIISILALVLSVGWGVYKMSSENYLAITRALSSSMINSTGVYVVASNPEVHCIACEKALLDAVKSGDDVSNLFLNTLIVNRLFNDGGVYKLDGVMHELTSDEFNLMNMGDKEYIRQNAIFYDPVVGEYNYASFNTVRSQVLGDFNMFEVFKYYNESDAGKYSYFSDVIELGSYFNPGECESIKQYFLNKMGDFPDVPEIICGNNSISFIPVNINSGVLKLNG